MVDLAAVVEVMAKLGPYLVWLKDAGGKVAEGVETKFGEKALEFLLARFKGKPEEETLRAAMDEPGTKTLRHLKTAVEDMAEEDEGFRKELEALVKGAGNTQSSTQTGDGNVSIQTIGSGNRFKVAR